MIPDELLLSLEFDALEAHPALRILVGLAAFAVLLRREALGEGAAPMSAAVATGVLAVAALPALDPNAHLAHPIGALGACMVAASVPLWIGRVAPALMMGLATAAVVLHLTADLADMGTVAPASSWIGIVLVGGAAGAALFGRVPGLVTVFAASGAAAWSLGFGHRPVAVGVAFLIGLAVSDGARLAGRFLGRGRSYKVG